MNKYEQRIAELQEQIEADNAEYALASARINQLATNHCNQYNSLTCIINVERHLMRKEIRELYHFLKHFGDIGDPITIFDFVAEEWLSVQNFDAVSSTSNTGTFNKYIDHSALTALTGVSAAGSIVAGSAIMGGSSMLAGAASASMISATVTSIAAPMILPAAIPAYILIRDWQKKAKDKNDLAALEQRAALAKTNHQECIKKAQNEAIFLSNAVQIVDLYRKVIVMVRDAIQDTILPELDGIMSFLYADAIKNAIINNENPDSVVIGKISEYRATAYDNHYQFVRNAFDYYRTITKFFTSKVMDKFVKNRKISKSDYQSFNYEVEKIIGKQQQLSANAIFGGQGK